MTGKSSSIALVIPARWGSTRFPGKPLHLIAGKPLIQHVWERSLLARKIDRVLIATDDQRIRVTAEGFGAEVIITSPDHPTGTDRIAEVATRFRGITHFINVQGDEPLIDPALIEQLAATLRRNPSIAMITAATPFADPREADFRDAATVDRLHLGIYGYRRDTLKRLVRLAPTPLEMAEKLEQLRALEHGIPIRVVQTTHRGIGVDTPADALRVEKILSEEN